MDITDSPPEKIDAGVEHLIAGGSISYHGVVFYQDKLKRPPQLVVSSYSDYIHAESIRPEEAKEKIERSKHVASDLAEKSGRFRSFWEMAHPHFVFCFDTGTAGILLAEELEGEIVWKNKRKPEPGG